MKRFLLACALLASLVVAQVASVNLSFRNYSEMTNYTVYTWQTNLVATLAGGPAAGDTGNGTFYYIPASVSAVDNTNVFAVTGVAGRWVRSTSPFLREIEASALYQGTNATLTDLPGAVTVSGTNVNVIGNLGTYNLRITNVTTYTPAPVAPIPAIGEAPLYSATTAGQARLQTVTADGTSLSPIMTEYDGSVRVADLDALRAYTGDATAIFVADTNRGGMFTYTWTAHTTNSGTIYEAADGGRWMRDYDGPVNSAWFGSRPTDSVELYDSVMAIQAALDFAGSAVEGGEVYIPGCRSGQFYLLSTNLVLPTGLRALYGDGRAAFNTGNTRIHWTHNGPGITNDVSVRMSSLVITGLELRGNAYSGGMNTNRTTGMILRNITRLRVEDCAFYAWLGGAGMEVSGIWGMNVNNCTFQICKTGLIIARPPVHILTASVSSANGTGYAIGDTVRLTRSVQTAGEISAVLTVTGVDGAGAITNCTLTSAGTYFGGQSSLILTNVVSAGGSGVTYASFAFTRTSDLDTATTAAFVEKAYMQNCNVGIAVEPNSNVYASDCTIEGPMDMYATLGVVKVKNSASYPLLENWYGPWLFRSGLVDVNGDGICDANDDLSGTTLLWQRYQVVDGKIDLNNDGSIDGSDTGIVKATTAFDIHTGSSARISNLYTEGTNLYSAVLCGMHYKGEVISPALTSSVVVENSSLVDKSGGYEDDAYAIDASSAYRIGVYNCGISGWESAVKTRTALTCSVMSYGNTFAYMPDTAAMPIFALYSPETLGSDGVFHNTSTTAYTLAPELRSVSLTLNEDKRSVAAYAEDTALLNTTSHTLRMNGNTLQHQRVVLDGGTKTVSQSTTNLTASASTFTPAHVGLWLYLPTPASTRLAPDLITSYASATQVGMATSRAIIAQAFQIRAVTPLIEGRTNSYDDVWIDANALILTANNAPTVTSGESALYPVEDEESLTHLAIMDESGNTGFLLSGYPNAGSSPPTIATNSPTMWVNTGTTPDYTPSLMYRFLGTNYFAHLSTNDSQPYVEKAGDTMTGTLTVTGLTNSALTGSKLVLTAADKSLASSTITDTDLVLKGGDTMTGPLYVTGLTNNALTASKIVLSGADKSLTSSTLGEADILTEAGASALYQSTNALLTSIAGTVAQYTGDIPVLIAGGTTNLLQFSSGVLTNRVEDYVAP